MVVRFNLSSFLKSNPEKRHPDQAMTYESSSMCGCTKFLQSFPKSLIKEYTLYCNSNPYCNFKHIP